MYVVTKVRESTNGWGESYWLLELDDDRAVLVQWSGSYLMAKLADTNIRELWALELGKPNQEGQKLALYLPDVRTHDWEATKPYLRDKFLLPEEVPCG